MYYGLIDINNTGLIAHTKSLITTTLMTLIMTHKNVFYYIYTVQHKYFEVLVITFKNCPICYPFKIFFLQTIFVAVSCDCVTEKVSPFSISYALPSSRNSTYRSSDVICQPRCGSVLQVIQSQYFINPSQPHVATLEVSCGCHAQPIHTAS